MSDNEPIPVTTPPCPMCAQATYLKQTHREHIRELRLLVFKCLSCAVEYPVVAHEFELRNPGPQRGVISQMPRRSLP